MSKNLKMWAAGAVACLIGAPIASADFFLTFNRVQVATGPNAGKDVIYWGGYNDGANGTGTKLLGAKATMSTDGNFIFRFANLDPDSTADVDALMAPSQTFNYSDGSSRQTPGFSLTATSANIGSAIRPRGTGEVFGQYTAQTFAPPNPTSNPAVVTDADGNVVTATPTSDPSLFYNNSNIKSFRVEGAYLSPSNAPLANNTALNAQGVKGSLFAISVVPRTDTVTMTARLAGDIGDPQDLVLTSPAPEPATFGLLGVGAVGLLARRRRKA